MQRVTLPFIVGAGGRLNEVGIVVALLVVAVVFPENISADRHNSAEDVESEDVPGHAHYSSVLVVLFVDVVLLLVGVFEPESMVS